MKNHLSTIFTDFLKDSVSVLMAAQRGKFEKLFNSSIDELNRYTWLVKRAKNIFSYASTQLCNSTLLCVGAALLAAMGGIGAAACPEKHKKARWAFAALAVTSSLLSLTSAIILYKVRLKIAQY
jgi:hypothetical protein